MGNAVRMVYWHQVCTCVTCTNLWSVGRQVTRRCCLAGVVSRLQNCVSMEIEIKIAVVIEQSYEYGCMLGARRNSRVVKTSLYRAPVHCIRCFFAYVIKYPEISALSPPPFSLSTGAPMKQKHRSLRKRFLEGNSHKHYRFIHSNTRVRHLGYPTSILHISIIGNGLLAGRRRSVRTIVEMVIQGTYIL